MTNTSQPPGSLDEILTNLEQYNLGDDPVTDEPFKAEETYAIYKDLAAAKAALEALLIEAREDEWRIAGEASVDLYDHCDRRLAELQALKDKQLSKEDMK